MAEQLIRDVVDLQEQVTPRDTIIPILKLLNDSLPEQQMTVKINKQNIGHAFILGHPVNGVLGVTNGIDSQQVTIGNGGLGANTLAAVVSANDEYYETLRNTDYTDLTLTTATVDTTNFKIIF